MFMDAVIDLQRFNREQMGAKSNNLKVLKDKVPDWVHLPESVCVPFQFMEHALEVCDEAGYERIKRLIGRLSKTKSPSKMQARLIRCKKIVLQL